MSLVLGSPVSPPAQAALHLLPLHIAHDGPAPVGTFFRPRPASARFPGQDGARSPDQKWEKPEEDMEDASTPTAKLAALSVGDARRLTASFRGREMQGLRVTLPAGFVGAVLRPPLVAAASAPTYQSSAPPMKADASRAKKDVAAAKARAKRASRRAKHTGVEAEPEEQAVPVSEEAEPQYLAQEDVLVPDEEKDASRVLRPTATFGVFTLWNPDIAVDEGKDEYLRSLTEWVDIAAEIHRY